MSHVQELVPVRPPPEDDVGRGEGDGKVKTGVEQRDHGVGKRKVRIKRNGETKGEGEAEMTEAGRSKERNN